MRACFEIAVEHRRNLARLLAMPGAFCIIAQQKEEALGFLLLRIAGDEAEIISHRHATGSAPPGNRRDA